MESNTDIRQAAISMLTDCNAKYHLTIDFPRFTLKRITQNILNDLLTILNQSIFKKRYAKGNNSIEGYCVREPTRKMETVHYHILIATDKFLPEFEKLIEKKIAFIKKQYKRNHITKWKLQNYTNDGRDKLETYLTKSFESYKNQREALDNIGILGLTNIEYSTFELK